MIIVNNEEIVAQHNELLQTYLSGACAPLLTSKFMAKSFPALEEAQATARKKKTGKDYPYQVKIPKSLKEMTDGDFEPKQVLKIEEPFKGPFCNIWFGTTLNGIKFRWGYVNGDSRKISEDALNDSTVHGFLAGATGQGKSVTLNSIIYGCCMEYPPWELVMTLSDAKIVEFKTLATSHPLPHIDIVAATSDCDYLISMLEQKFREMQLRQSVFTKAGEVFHVGVKNIKEFREVTGLCMPRNIMIFDECTAMFQNAGKKVNRIVELIDGIGRLGRNAGFHLLLTSQEVSSDIPDKTLANLTLRGAMGCTGPISEKVIGNDEAVTNMGKKGRLLVNANASSKNNKASNVLVRVPFTPESEVNAIADSVIKLGKQTQTAQVLRFYDEEERLYEDRYRSFIRSFEWRSDRILLGPPSFIMDSPEQVVSVPIVGDNTESICVFANESMNKLRAMEMLKINLCGHPDNVHMVLAADPMYARESSLDEISSNLRFEERTYDNSQFIDIARSTIYRRALCIKTDKLAFTDGKTNPEIDKIFYGQLGHENEFDTVINRCRFKYYIEFLKNDPEIIAGLKMKSQDEIVKNAAACVRMCHTVGGQKTPVERSSFTNFYCWLLGMERLIGLGRDNKSKFSEDFKKLLQDGTMNNVRFIVFTSTFDDLGSIATDFGYFLLEDLSNKQASQIKVSDDYPNKLASGLMLLFRPAKQSTGRVLKFKKMMFEGEM